MDLLPETQADGQQDLEDVEEEEEVSMGSGNPEEGERAKNSSKFHLRKSPVFSDENSDLDFDVNKLDQRTTEKEEERKDGHDGEVEDTDSDEDEGGLFGSKKLKSGNSSRNLKWKDFFDLVESDEDIASVHDDKLGSNKMKQLLKERKKN
ncbi:hypothetical protein P7K49_012821 [Saguinus oedipus]|uniref:Uncharacterized protein n=1 Tax=Saguinus oedipus TaxID=9490 RepID=A0ABQ9VEF8_SAGOE|nr:hypothetical protein P7K49_012821 [Saguinus oedipus]